MMIPKPWLEREHEDKMNILLKYMSEEDANFCLALDKLPMSSWSDIEMNRYNRLTGQAENSNCCQAKYGKHCDGACTCVICAPDLHEQENSL